MSLDFQKKNYPSCRFQSCLITEFSRVNSSKPVFPTLRKYHNFIFKSLVPLSVYTLTQKDAEWVSHSSQYCWSASDIIPYETLQIQSAFGQIYEPYKWILWFGYNSCILPITAQNSVNIPQCLESLCLSTCAILSAWNSYSSLAT